MKKKILILGGGFAGIEAAIKINKKEFDVHLVSNREYLFIYPVSIWVPVKKRTFRQVSIPLEKLSNKHKFNLLIDDVVSLNTEKNEVTCNSITLSYDYLVIALGMGKIKAKGLDNTLSICGHPEDSVNIEKRIDELVAKGKGNIAIGFGGNPKDPSATAVRGGPAFELLFNISHYLRKKKIRNNFELNFFAPMKEPGKKMGEKAFGKLDLFMKRYGINTYTGKKIAEFTPNEIVFEDETKLSTDLTIFISGGSGHPALLNSNLPKNVAGFVSINENCQVTGHENIFAIGDSAALEGPAWAAKQGHIAEVMADVAAYNIREIDRNSSNRRSYKEHINIICVMDTGDGAAIVYRDSKKDFIILLPIVGHWLKQSWGFYYKYSKLKIIPRIPGM